MARPRLALTLATILVVAAGDRAPAQAAPASPLPPDPSPVLLPPVVSGPVLDRPSDIQPASDSALPVSREPAARIALDASQYMPVRTHEYDDSRRASNAGPQADDTDDGLAYLTDGRYRRGADGRATRSKWEESSTRNEGMLAGLWNRWFGKEGDRTPGDKFGDRVGEMMNGGRGDVERRWFESDQAFCDFVSPISNPFFFEDPRSLTELRGIGFYQNIPSNDGFFRGGNAWFFGGQGRLAFTQRISLVVHKFGFAAFNPGGGSIFRGGSGLSELWIGPKVVVYRDPEFKSLISVGTQFQIPLGGSAPLQDTGNLSIVPYVSAAQKLLGTEIGTLNGMASAGYSFSTTRDRSDFFYTSLHLDFDIANGHRFYPVAELNWFSYTTDGRARNITTEGRDLANVGAAAKGNNLVTWALGMRWRSLNGRWELGGGYEGYMFGQRGLFDGRVMFDVIWRF
jgi:hypothetical protein